jgi:hypothetical protein
MGTDAMAEMQATFQKQMEARKKEVASQPRP